MRRRSIPQDVAYCVTVECLLIFVDQVPEEASVTIFARDISVIDERWRRKAIRRMEKQAA